MSKFRPNICPSIHPRDCLDQPVAVDGSYVTNLPSETHRAQRSQDSSRCKAEASLGKNTTGFRDYSVLTTDISLSQCKTKVLLPFFKKDRLAVHRFSGPKLVAPHPGRILNAVPVFPKASASSGWPLQRERLMTPDSRLYQQIRRIRSCSTPNYPANIHAYHFVENVSSVSGCFESRVWRAKKEASLWAALIRENDKTISVTTTTAQLPDIGCKGGGGGG
ncbi:unnamed protein product [Leuciscus chuanchicus]